MEQLFCGTNALIRFLENDEVVVPLLPAIEMSLPIITADEKFSSLGGTDVLILPGRSS